MVFKMNVRRNWNMNKNTPFQTKSKWFVKLSSIVELRLDQKNS